MRAGYGSSRLSLFLLSLILAALSLPSSGCFGRASLRPAAEASRRATGVEKVAYEEPVPAPAADARQPVYHPLEPGLTLYSLAHAYDVPLGTLLQANGITDPTSIPAGTPILIPGATRRRTVLLPGTGPSPSVEPPTVAIEPRDSVSSRARPFDVPAFVWPLRGAVTSAFGTRGRHRHHEGVDIDGNQGDAILAAAAGTVLRADSEGQYGRMVVIDHGQGMTTLYAHASRLLVRPGDRVKQGDLIAEVGHSGNAHGTHLHFEVRREGQALDPLPLLERGLMTATHRPRRPSPAPAKASVLSTR